MIQYEPFRKRQKDDGGDGEENDILDKDDDYAFQQATQMIQ